MTFATLTCSESGTVEPVGDLAYGDPPKRPGAPGGPLVFDVELISIK